MTPEDILALRFQNQKLIATPFTKIQEIVSWLGAVQSQDYQGAKWGLAQRLKHATDASIEKAFNDGDILRTHVMRPTWHFVTPNDIRWMLRLTAPRVKAIMASYNKKLELTEEVFKKAQKVFIKRLSGKKALSRQVLKTELNRIGIKTNVQRLAHLVMEAELDAIICSGPLLGKQFTYMLLDERAPKTRDLTHEESLAELSKRYFTSHGPATLRDFVWWSGLKTNDARKGIELNKPRIRSEEIEGKIYYFFTPNLPKLPNLPDSAYLLPNYDEYGIAYTEREAFFRPEYNKLLNARGNTGFQHLFVWKKQITGTWKRTLKKDSVLIEVKFFKKPSATEYKAFQKAAVSYAHFINKTLTLRH